MRGRKPTAATLKLAAGTHQHPTPAVEVPEPPDVLRDEARAEWERITVELFTMGLIARVDRAALVIYCQSWAEWVHAVEQIAATGPIVQSPQGFPLLNPWLSVRDRAARTITSMLSEFGLSPAARFRLATTRKAEKKAKSKWEGLIANG